MKYRSFIETYFLIDEPKTGMLVPFKFNQAQQLYYEELVHDYDIEKKGLTIAVREFIVKARREGFSSLILAIFAADDIMQTAPTETQVVSYKDDATNVFRKRYRRFVLSYFAQKSNVPIDQIQRDANILEKYKRIAFSVDASDLELRHNRAHFFCGTAAARTGGRGGVLQKLLFSEAAHYQDTEHMTAKEIIDGTAQQVDKASGWIFQESTGNGKGNYFFQTYEQIKRGLSRYMLRFYGWRKFYSEEQFAVIASEFTDADMLKQEYPENEEEAFMSSGLSFTNEAELLALVGADAEKSLEVQLELSGVNYIDQCDSIKAFALTFARTHPNHNLYLGLDTAKDIDRTVLTILMKRSLSPGGGVKGISIDSTGQGDFVPDWFERNTNWYIHRVKFSRPTKSVMYKILQTVLKKKSTKLPQIKVAAVGQGPIVFMSDELQHFYMQMLDLQKQIIGDMLVVAHPSGQCKKDGHDYDNCHLHDDHPDSWALAELLYVVLNGLPKGQTPPDESSGPNFDSAVRRMLTAQKAHTSDGSEDYV